MATKHDNKPTEDCPTPPTHAEVALTAALSVIGVARALCGNLDAKLRDGVWVQHQRPVVKMVRVELSKIAQTLPYNGGNPLLPPSRIERLRAEHKPGPHHGNCDTCHVLAELDSLLEIDIANDEQPGVEHSK